MNLRSLLYLLWLLLPSVATAQDRALQYKPYIDERQFHYGFYVGLHDQGLHLQNNGYTVPSTGAQWLVANDRQNLGFSVGVLGDWKLNRYFSLRLTPGLHFGSKHLTLRNQLDQKEITQDLKSTYLAVPVLLKVAAPRFNNYRPYVVGGLSAMYDLTPSKGAYLRTKPLQMYAEVGLGCDFYLPFFKLIPELRFAFGLHNVLQRERKDLTSPAQLVYTQSVEAATPNMVTLIFHFE